ncbi:hypothetical protein FLA_2415 [Filimonas lacunae]|nr:hypothetical protein FLA_2415 [Filimonas lacunae]
MAAKVVFRNSLTRRKSDNSIPVISRKKGALPLNIGYLW